MPESEKLLTIVVPVYAVAGFLHQCLDSLHEGLGTDETAQIEIIAVDDASPDDCGTMLDAYAARHPGVRVVHLPHNVGLGLARNAGLAEARGDYVWFVDSDDWLPTGSVRAVLQRLAAGPDVLLIDHLRVYEDGHHEVDSSSHLLQGVAGPTSLAERPELLRLQHTAWNKIIKRALLERLDLRFLPGWYEDVPFSHPVLIGARRIDVLDRVCYLYRQGRPGAITSSVNDRHFEAFDQYERLQEWVRARDVEPRLAADLFHLMINHYLVVLGNDGRLHPARRREFFRRAAGHYRRFHPAGAPMPSGSTGLKHRLIRMNNYPLYAALRLVYRLAQRRGTPQAGTAGAMAPGAASSSGIQPGFTPESPAAQGRPLG